jgi:hypothetical protein
MPTHHMPIGASPVVAAPGAAGPMSHLAPLPVQADGGHSLGGCQADALALPFDDQSFDAVVCQFGVMFFLPDRVAAFRRALESTTVDPGLLLKLGRLAHNRERG